MVVSAVGHPPRVCCCFLCFLLPLHVSGSLFPVALSLPRSVARPLSLSLSLCLLSPYLLFWVYRAALAILHTTGWS